MLYVLKSILALSHKGQTILESIKHGSNKKLYTKHETFITKHIIK